MKIIFENESEKKFFDEVISELLEFSEPSLEDEWLTVLAEHNLQVKNERVVEKERVEDFKTWFEEADNYGCPSYGFHKEISSFETLSKNPWELEALPKMKLEHLLRYSETEIEEES